MSSSSHFDKPTFTFLEKAKSCILFCTVTWPSQQKRHFQMSYSSHFDNPTFLEDKHTFCSKDATNCKNWKNTIFVKVLFSLRRFQWTAKAIFWFWALYRVFMIRRATMGILKTVRYTDLVKGEKSCVIMALIQKWH